MVKEINITYETLFELLRKERSQSDLQKLDENFFEDVISYLKEKKSILEKTDENNFFLKTEKDRSQKQLENTKNILKDLYEKREKKIIEMALNKSRTNLNIEINSMLKEEIDFYNKTVNLLNLYRKSILFNITNIQLPTIKEEKQVEEKKINNDKNIETKKNNKEIKVVRFIHAIPKFLGPELETYGPFDQEDIANLPAKIADILVIKKRAEEINED